MEGETSMPERADRSAVLDVQSTLDLLERVRRSAQECRAGAERNERELAQNRTRIEQQFQKASQAAQERLGSGVAAAEDWRQARRKEAEARHERRKGRLVEARRTAQTKRLQWIGEQESREVFRIQRELLQVDRDRETARQAEEQRNSAWLTEWAAERERTDGFSARAHAAFRGYRAFRGLLAAPEGSLAGVSMEPGSRVLLEQCRSLLGEAEGQLARFRRAPLPLLFRWFSPWVCSVFLIVAHAAAVPLLGHFDLARIRWEEAGVSLAVMLLATWGLHALGGRLSGAGARGLSGNLHRVLALLDASARAAVGEHEEELERIRKEAEARTRDLEGRWNVTREQSEAQRSTLKDRLDKKLMGLQARLQAREDRLLGGLQRENEEAATRLGKEAELERTRVSELKAEQVRQLEAQHVAGRQALAADWRAVAEPASAAFSATGEASRRLFPEWDDAVWENWTAPESFVSAVPFGRLTVDLARFCGGLPRDESVAWPGEGRFELPLLLTFPRRGSILFETQDQGRGAAVSTLNELVLRLLAASPPGRVLFTILDPVGLGQSFAGLMHLTDHEDRLINRRIWTQPDHVEQRLGDLNEHIEKVTQLYLRNEYPTIADYNAKAGRIAEPYHFLVVADFPTNFTDLAVRRLISIATSGPRCGVFTFIHWDCRKPTPLEFAPEDLRKASIVVRAAGEGFALAEPVLEGTTLKLVNPPDALRATQLLQRVGRSSVDSNRVEMPFSRITPEEKQAWSLDTTTELRVPIGITGATKFQYLALGKGTRQHVLIAGKTGSGKSTLFHVLVTNLALWCSPEEVEFYLVDFKKGVEFKCYAVQRLPQARVVAIESDREFGLSVLEKVDDELHRRGDLFRELGVQDLAGYRRAGKGEALPRTLLIVDEFQELFTEDDRVAQNAALLLDRLVRQGRAFGIHVLLGSQTLGGAYTLARTTLGQMVVRIALQCNQADALLIMEDDNLAPRLLSRPGEAIYNDAAGAIEGNSPFQIVWLPEEEREVQLKWARQLAERHHARPRELVVFEGNAPSQVRENQPLRELLAAGGIRPAPAARMWLGTPNSIKGPTEVVLDRQNGHHLLVVGQYDESALAMLGISMIALAGQYRREGARFLMVDVSPAGSPQRQFLERVAAAIPQEIVLVTAANLDRVMAGLAEEFERRGDPEPAATAPSVYLVLHHLERFKGLRFDDDYGFTSGGGDGKSDPGRTLQRVLSEGASLGIHVLGTCDTFSNATRCLGRKAVGAFELRVLFQMSANDSASLIDSPSASTLGLHRALLHNVQTGTVEVFRPYAVPDDGWIDEAARQLRRLAG